MRDWLTKVSQATGTPYGSALGRSLNPLVILTTMYAARTVLGLFDDAITRRKKIQKTIMKVAGSAAGTEEA